MAKVIHDITPSGKIQIPQEDQSIFDSQFKNQSSNVSYGLSFLNSISTLFLQQEANLDQNQTKICHRDFILHVSDQSNKEIIRITRQFKCFGGCLFWCTQVDCCAYEVVIESPPGVVLGTVRQMRSYLSLRDAMGKEHLRVIGPCCICRGLFCCSRCENKFKLINAGNNIEIGEIFKQCGGLVNQTFTGAEKYTITFPIEMPVQLKCIALGALFLINCMHLRENVKSKGGTSIISLLC